MSFLSSAKYCTHCGGKLKVGAKFCTICGTKQTSSSSEVPSSQTNSYSSYSKSSRTQQRSSYSSSKSSFQQRSPSSFSTSSSSQLYTDSADKTGVITPSVEKNSTQGFTLTTLLSLEVEIDEITKKINDKENQSQTMSVYGNAITATKKKESQLNLSLTTKPQIKSFLQNVTWNQLKEYKSRNASQREYEEIKYVFVYITDLETKELLNSLTEFYQSQENANELSVLKNNLKQKQNSLESNHQKWLRGITNYRDYTKTLTNLSYFQAKNVEDENNIIILDRARNTIESVLEILSAIKMDTEYSLSSYFSYNQILASVDNDNLLSIINKCAVIDKKLFDIEFHLSQVKYKNSVLFYKNVGSTLIKSIVNDYFSSNSFQDSVSLINKVENNLKNLNDQVKDISTDINLSHQNISKSISLLKDSLLKMRQDYLMTGRVKYKVPYMSDLPQLEKNSLQFSNNLNLELNNEILSNLDGLSTYLDGPSLNKLIENDQKEVSDESNYDTDDIFANFESNVNETMFKISMPKVPKLTTMNSLFLTQEDEHKLSI